MFNGVTQEISQERFYVQVRPQNVSDFFCQRHQSKTPSFLGPKRRQIVVGIHRDRENSNLKMKKHHFCNNKVGDFAIISR